MNIFFSPGCLGVCLKHDQNLHNINVESHEVSILTDQQTNTFSYIVSTKKRGKREKVGGKGGICVDSRGLNNHSFYQKLLLTSRRLELKEHKGRPKTTNIVKETGRQEKKRTSGKWHIMWNTCEE